MSDPSPGKLDERSNDVHTDADEARMDEFVVLFAGHQRRLFSFVKSLLPSGTDVDDVLQEASLVLWREFHTFETGTNFAAWANRVAFNQVLAFRKRRQRDRLRFSEEFLEAVSRDLNEREDALEERVNHLGRCLEELPNHHRELVETRYSGASIDALTEQLDKSADAVYRLLSRIRRTLHDCISRRLRTRSA